MEFNNLHDNLIAKFSIFLSAYKITRSVIKLESTLLRVN